MRIHRAFPLALVLILACGLGILSCGKDDGPWYIPGTATLPDCMDPPAFDLDGTEWFDNGVVTIESAGCEPAMTSDEFDSCALTWVMSQEGADVRILVDTEYRIKGRLCGDVLYLQGGWWLPVEDEDVCTYDDDSAEEVGIQDGGSSLVVGLQTGGSMLEATGTLSLQGPCEATYEVVLSQFK